MTKYSSLLLIIFLQSVLMQLQAQQIKSASLGLEYIYRPLGYNIVFQEPSLSRGTVGSPYLDDWQSSTVFLKNSDTITSLLVRYNVFQNQMMYKLKDLAYIIENPDSISEIKFPNKTFIYNEYTKGEQIEKTFFEIVYNGRVSLLNKYRIEFIPASHVEGMDVGAKNDVLSLKQQLYLKHGDKIVVLNKKNKFLEELSDKKQEIADYMDRENLSINKKEDVIKILSYYNQALSNK